MFEWFKKLFKRREKIDWSKAKLIQDTKKPLLENLGEKNEFKEVEKVSKESFNIYEGFLICEKDKVEQVESALRKIKEKDVTFPNIDRTAYLIVLRSNNKDELHKKLSWVVGNVDGCLGYFVRQLK